MIQIPCPVCGQVVKAPEEMAGKTGRCECGELLRFPSRRVAEPNTAAARNPPMILCYACRKSVAEDAPRCGRCGADQSAQAKEAARQGKTRADLKLLAQIAVACVLVIPVVACCSGLRRGATPARQQTWDMEQLKRDSEEVARDPSKTILIPADGSQPKVVPAPAPSDD